MADVSSQTFEATRGNPSLVLAAAEAVALRSWAPSGRVPLAWGHDAAADALLLVAQLIGGLHRRGVARLGRGVVSLAERVEFIHPGNVLVGGLARGLVAIDPRPCVGEAEFDAVDWVCWGVSGLLAVAQP